MSATLTKTIGAPSDARELAQRALDLMTEGGLAAFEETYAADAVNREAVMEPAATRRPGPKGLYATAMWLRAMFAGLAFEIHEVAADRDLIVAHSTMSGRHVGDAVFYRPDASVDQAFPPTGRTFAVTQTHWFRVADGKVVEHWANRDDQGMAMQLGWVPPTPAYLFRMWKARRRARRAAG